jgi:CubicO group peptidase (beta-lactamase class C family)
MNRIAVIILILGCFVFIGKPSLPNEPSVRCDDLVSVLPSASTGIVPTALAGQSKKPALDTRYEKTDSITIFIEREIKEWEVPGLAVSVVMNGEVIYEKGFGVRDIASQEAVDSETLFYLASGTKTFTSALAFILQQEKMLSIDVPVKSYIPEFGMRDLEAGTRVTLRDMLTHRTGIPREKFFTLNNISSRKEVLHSYSLFEPAMEFRTGFLYSNENYTVAGDIMAEIAGDSWESLIDKKIFGPLEMINSYFCYDDIIKRNYASPYIDWGNGIEKMELYDARFIGAAGSIITNVRDLSNWVKLYLNRGKYKAQQILPLHALVQQVSAQVPSKPFSSLSDVSFECYGVGWFLDYYRGHFHVHHGGVLYGYTSLISFLPNDNFGVVIMANKNNTPVTSIIERYIIDILLEMEPVNWNERYKVQEARVKEMMKSDQSRNGTVENVKIDAQLASRYVGSYFCDGFGKINIEYDNDSLICRMRGIICSFEPLSEKEFLLNHPVEHLAFEVHFDFVDDKTAGFSVQIGIGDQKVYYKRIKG